MQPIQPMAQCEEAAVAREGSVMVRLLPTNEIEDGDAALAARLAGDEAARASKFHHAADRKAYVGAHALLRTLLSQAMPGEAPPRAWRFAEGPRGKPHLDPAQARDVRFNLSHCRGMVAVAIAQGAEVGVDVEAIERHDFDEDAIAASHFCAAERARLARIADAASRKHAFLALWTAKEALIKALGDGLSMPLDGFCADLERGTYVRYDAPHRDGEWSLARWQRPGYLVALAAPAGRRVECREMRWDASASVFVEGGALAPLPCGEPG